MAASAEELAFAQAHARPRSSFVGCSRISDWEILGKLGEGTFGEVHRARSRRNGVHVAMKKIIMHNEKDGFPITALREIRLLKLLSHPNVLRLEDMSVEYPQRVGDKRKRPSMYMITPYMDHDLSGLLDNPEVIFTVPQIKCYMLQLLEGLRYLHDSHILHRDMKAANLLIDNNGILQIADFGLARHYSGPTPRPGLGSGSGDRDYTGLVVTRWYRPPELLLCLRKYTPAIDVWGVGCVFGEMLTGKPILTGESDHHQLEIIWDLVGSPTDVNMPGWRTLPGAEGLKLRSRPGCLSTKFKEHGPQAVSLLKELLNLDWRGRINAGDALHHPYFKIDPLPAKPHELPKFEESHELDRKKFQDRKAALPPAPKGGIVCRADDPNDLSSQRNGGGRYNDRNGSNSFNGSGDGSRRPAWARGERGLPPRPPDKVDANNYSRDRDFDKDRRSRGGWDRRDDKDSYVPNYGRDSGRYRDDRDRDRDRDRERGGDRRDRDRDRDRDDRRYRDDHRDRDERDRRDRRTRSRSPGSSGRDRNRDRDSYRR
ncbi:hypothetical protein BROUX41_001680 [Berkeleyomyces rouxiae]|uniref:uncharacterized protein n=1 Tax=Berkeleyomyces rouxiae TaxID=2035830 RepID=UPI003B7B4F4C